MKEMRRKDRKMNKDFTYSIIDKAQFCNLATINEDGSPYCIPISFVRHGDKVYIHSARQGTKIENIKNNPNVCMSFVGDINIPFPDRDSSVGKRASEVFTTEFESAIIFRTANIILDNEEKILGLRLLCEKYTPNNMSFFDDAVEDALRITNVIRIDILDISGKRKKYDKDGIEMKWGRI